MRTGLRLSVIALLLALNAPLASAGPCGHCDRGLPCPRIDLPAAADDRPCCGGGAEAGPARSSLGAARCECGGDPPPAVAACGPPPAGPALAATPAGEATPPTASSRRASAASRHPPAPPPPAPVFLLDCAFLI
ncbi:MAG: hypothetical protein MUE90_04720 [Thermoanaerobaculales bacterium]|nr:hypothetical protein [Thermoanaerobaculales bacterium]